MSSLPKSYFNSDEFNAFEQNISSIECDQSLVAQENRQLQKQLRSLLSNVRQNEEKLKRFQELELRLIACSTLFELLQIVIYEYRVTSNLDRVTLVLHDPEYELQRMLEDEGVRTSDHCDIIFSSDVTMIDAFYGFELKPFLGQYDVKNHRDFFPNVLAKPSSVALLPLSRDMELLGSLNLASHHNNRFEPNSASDFLQRLASIVTICLNNVCNQERLKRLGLTDMLTGVNNRRFFDQRLEEEAGRAQRDNQLISCLFFDIDLFKRVNDTYGHNDGDIVLQDVANLVRMNLRTSDVFARYGGEEFAAILNSTDSEKAIEIAERIRAGVEDRLFSISHKRMINITISIGVATMQAGNYSINTKRFGQQLIQKADLCLYEAKRTGRNRVICYTDEPPKDKKQQLEMFTEELVLPEQT